MNTSNRAALAAALIYLSSPASAQELTEQARIAFDASLPGGTGQALALDGDTLLCGSMAQSSSATGRVVVLVGGGPTWTEQAVLAPPAGSGSYSFGSALALDGDVAVVGDRTDRAGSSEGAAFVFVRSGSTWSFQQRLTAASSISDASFGVAVAVEGDTILVGAADEDLVGFFSGAAYVFRDVGGTWSEEARLQPEDAIAEQHFGSAVALEGGLAVVGADFRACIPGIGAVYTFERPGSTWTQTSKLQAATGAVDLYGISLALENGFLVVGAPGEEPFGNDSGAAYVYRRRAGGWEPSAHLTTYDGTPNDLFGWSVAFAGERVVVGARRADAPSGIVGSGAAYVFQPDGAGGWRSRCRLVAHDGAVGDEAGWAVAAEADFFHVAAPRAGARGHLDSFRDELAATFTCSGKTNSLGCVPFLSTHGAASESGDGPMRISAHDVLPQEVGILMYGFGGSDLPFHGGTLCVKAPLVRFPAKSATAVPGATCGGVLTKEFQSAIQTGADPRLTAGEVVHAQWRQRDPHDPAGFGDGLSNGVRFAIGP